MKHRTQCGPNEVHPVAKPVSLGRARRLTRASFSGNQAEMIADRQYNLGG